MTRFAPCVIAASEHRTDVRQPHPRAHRPTVADGGGAGPRLRSPPSVGPPRESPCSIYERGSIVLTSYRGFAPRRKHPSPGYLGTSAICTRTVVSRLGVEPRRGLKCAGPPSMAAFRGTLSRFEFRLSSTLCMASYRVSPPWLVVGLSATH